MVMFKYSLFQIVRMRKIASEGRDMRQEAARGSDVSEAGSYCQIYSSNDKWVNDEVADLL